MTRRRRGPRMWATPAMDMPAAYYFETPYGLVGVSRYESADGWRTHAFPADRVPDDARREDEPAEGGPDRYTFSRDDGEIDELVLAGAYVHLERMSKRNYMLICENEHGHFHLSVRRATTYEVLIDGESYTGGDWEAPEESSRRD